MAFLGAFKDFAQKHLQLEKDDVQLQREKEQSAAAGEFGPLFDRLADDDAPAPEAPSASASAPTSWLGLGNLLDLSALHPGGGGYEDDADEPPQVRGLKGKVRALEARATEQAARLTQMDGQLDADRGIIKSLTVELAALQEAAKDAREDGERGARMRDEATRMLSDWAQKEAEHEARRELLAAQAEELAALRTELAALRSPPAVAGTAPSPDPSDQDRREKNLAAREAALAAREAAAEERERQWAAREAAPRPGAGGEAAEGTCPEARSLKDTNATENAEEEEEEEEDEEAETVQDPRPPPIPATREGAAAADDDGTPREEAREEDMEDANGRSDEA